MKQMGVRFFNQWVSTFISSIGIHFHWLAAANPQNAKVYWINEIPKIKWVSKLIGYMLAPGPEGWML